jgi:lysophospholipase L1-like esterase
MGGYNAPRLFEKDRSRYQMKSLKAKVCLASVSTIAALLIADGLARLAQTTRWQEVAAPSTVAAANHPYQAVRQVEDGDLCVLRPGAAYTFGELRDSLRSKDNPISRNLLARLPADADTDVALRINADGFRGPEIDKARSRPRLLCIGDSCTFGMAGFKTYPEAIQEALPETEVINAGVEGYSTREVLLRMREFKSLRPAITTVYLGWNQLFSEAPTHDGGLLEVARNATRSLARRQPGYAEGQYEKQKQVDPNEPGLAALDGWCPSVEGLRTIVRELKGAGCQVAVLTLPGLFTMDEPTELALQIGHLPEWTANPYALAKVTERYNWALKELASQEDLMLVDLDAWSRKVMESRDGYFFDSVHLYEEGQLMIGREIADRLRPVIERAARAARPGLTAS